MNMDGNCIVISVGIIGMIISTGTVMNPSKLMMIGLTVILLSVGAPNQPGSFLISLIVLMSFIGVSDNLYSDLVIIECFYGKIYSSINSIGDIITMVVEAKALEKNDDKDEGNLVCEEDMIVNDEVTLLNAEDTIVNGKIMLSNAEVMILSDEGTSLNDEN